MKVLFSLALSSSFNVNFTLIIEENAEELDVAYAK